MVENSINMYYESLEKKKLQPITNASEALNNKIKIKIEELNKKNINYSNLKFHRTVINSYNNKKGTCTITFQTSLEYIKDNIKQQERLNTDVIYIYDETDSKDAYGVSLNCKNCGGPIKKLGEKFCPYCGTGVVEHTKKVWKINDIYTK